MSADGAGLDSAAADVVTLAADNEAGLAAAVATVNTSRVVTGAAAVMTPSSAVEIVLGWLKEITSSSLTGAELDGEGCSSIIAT